MLTTELAQYMTVSELTEDLQDHFVTVGSMVSDFCFQNKFELNELFEIYALVTYVEKNNIYTLLKFRENVSTFLDDPQ